MPELLRRGGLEAAGRGLEAGVEVGDAAGLVLQRLDRAGVLGAGDVRGGGRLGEQLDGGLHHVGPEQGDVGRTQGLRCEGALDGGGGGLDKQEGGDELLAGQEAAHLVLAVVAHEDLLCVAGRAGQVRPQPGQGLQAKQLEDGLLAAQRPDRLHRVHVQPGEEGGREGGVSLLDPLPAVGDEAVHVGAPERRPGDQLNPLTPCHHLVIRVRRHTLDVTCDGSATS